MKVLYFAEDGKAFENKWECEAYEAKKLYESVAGDICGIGYDGKTVEFGTDDFADDCHYINIESGKAYEALLAYEERTGACIDGIDGPGLYVWNDEEFGGFEDGIWLLVSDVINEYRAAIETLMGIIDQF